MTTQTCFIDFTYAFLSDYGYIHTAGLNTQFLFVLWNQIIFVCSFTFPSVWPPVWTANDLTASPMHSRGRSKVICSERAQSFAIKKKKCSVEENMDANYHHGYQDTE